ncbi:hypothetical protein JNUCC1_00363 [Lentibacillus sp. JNUCC-1]|nr:cytochrome c oxidase subunit 2A [Lentibacillus sp. JNUCC-1]MUV36560.1 hypothetical protein [Lentibacillus sp. JNUCC-1]
MTSPKKTEMAHTDHEEVSMKGTLVSVLLIGGFIALLWFAIWGIYMMRV